RETQRRLEEMEERLAKLTREYERILENWSRTDERHAAAVAALNERLSDWAGIERRLLAESATRLQQFERNVLHEWNALRQKHEEPILRLDAQATRIAETCVSAVDAALRGFHGAEARRAAFEQDLMAHLSDLKREVRVAVEELRRSDAGRQALSSARPWSMEEVVRLHGELRAEDAGARALPPGGADTAQPVVTVTREEPPPSTPAPGRALRIAIAALAVGLVAAAAGVWSMNRGVRAGLRDVSARAEAAERAAVDARRVADEQVAAIEAAAESRVREAMQTAERAQRAAAVLSAPDLFRLEMRSAGEGQVVSATLLWSRSRGMVLNSAWLPPPPAGRTYQVWLRSPGAWTSAGTFAPDAAGRVDVAFDPPASLPRPVIGARITLEPESGSAQPNGAVVVTTRPRPREASGAGTDGPDPI
ncbi:MAG TPA: anti-sigma factor, partial [Vicinamibacterales bacterium]